MEIMTGEEVRYRHGDCTMHGYLVQPAGPVASDLAALVFPDGFGLGKPARRRAHMLADLGHVAFVADPYGGGINARDVSEGHALSGALIADPDEMRGRAAAALEAVRNLAGVDRDRIATIGYCFGGTCALEFARSEADVAALVSFHGALATSRPAQRGSIRPRLLIGTGSADPLIPIEQISAFAEEMTAAGAQWEVDLYGGAPHNFTNPEADLIGRPGVGYDAIADARSWQAMQDLFAATLAG